jgi:hypothetical protein
MGFSGPFDFPKLIQSDRLDQRSIFQAAGERFSPGVADTTQTNRRQPAIKMVTGFTGVSKSVHR